MSSSRTNLPPPNSNVFPLMGNKVPVNTMNKNVLVSTLVGTHTSINTGSSGIFTGTSVDTHIQPEAPKLTPTKQVTLFPQFVTEQSLDLPTAEKQAIKSLSHIIDRLQNSGKEQAPHDQAAPTQGDHRDQKGQMEPQQMYPSKADKQTVRTFTAGQSQVPKSATGEAASKLPFTPMPGGIMEMIFSAGLQSTANPLMPMVDESKSRRKNKDEDKEATTEKEGKSKAKEDGNPKLLAMSFDTGTSDGDGKNKHNSSNTDDDEHIEPMSAPASNLTPLTPSSNNTPQKMSLGSPSTPASSDSGTEVFKEKVKQLLEQMERASREGRTSDYLAFMQQYQHLTDTSAVNLNRVGMRVLLVMGNGILSNLVNTQAIFKIDAQKIISDGIDGLRQAKEVETSDQDKLGKDKAQLNNGSLIAGAVMDILLGAVQIIVGILKIVAAVMTFGGLTNEAVSGIADIVGGLASIARGGLEAWEASHPEDVDKFKDAIDALGWTVMSMGILSAAIDITGTAYASVLARNSAKEAANASAHVAQEGAEVAATLGAQQAEEQINKVAQALAKEIGESVLDDIDMQIANVTARVEALSAEAVEGGSQATIKAGVANIEKNMVTTSLKARYLAKVLNQEGLEKMFTPAIQNVLKKGTAVLKNLGGDFNWEKELSDVLAKTLTREIFKASSKEGTRIALTSVGFFNNNIRSGFLNGSVKIASASISKQIEDISALMDYQSSFLNNLKNSRDLVETHLQHLMETNVRSLKDTMQGLQKIYEVTKSQTQNFV